MPRTRKPAARSPDAGDLGSLLKSAWDEAAGPAADADDPDGPAAGDPAGDQDDDTAADDADDADGGDDDTGDDADDGGAGGQGTEGGALAGLMARLAPLARRFGMTPEAMVTHWAEVQQALLDHPREAVAWIAARHGVAPSADAGPPAGQAPALPPAVAAHLEPLRRDVQDLKQTLATRDRNDRMQRLAAARAAVDRFAADPANRHFPLVRNEAMALLRAGLATDLPDAYDKACALNPAVQAQRGAEQDAASDAERRARARRRQAAGASISGSPGTARPAAPATVRDALMAAWDDQ